MKQALGNRNVLYPTPTTLVGAIVEGKPNFITVAHVGILTHDSPNLVSLGMGKTHYTNQGIKANRAFSINLPSEALVAVTDYVGLVSGKKTDKAGLFEIFYGELQAAPMIVECPVNMVCRLWDVYDTPRHDIFIGEIVETFADASVLTDGSVDLGKVRPLLFDMSGLRYWGIGREVARCWNIGKSVKKEKGE